MTLHNVQGTLSSNQDLKKLKSFFYPEALKTKMGMSFLKKISENFGGMF